MNAVTIQDLFVSYVTFLPEKGSRKMLGQAEVTQTQCDWHKF